MSGTMKQQHGDKKYARDHISNEFRSRRHRLLEKVDDNRVEPLPQSRIPSECRLHEFQKIKEYSKEETERCPRFSGVESPEYG